MYTYPNGGGTRAKLVGTKLDCPFNSNKCLKQVYLFGIVKPTSLGASLHMACILGILALETFEPIGLDKLQNGYPTKVSQLPIGPHGDKEIKMLHSACIFL